VFAKTKISDGVPVEAFDRIASCLFRAVKGEIKNPAGFNEYLSQNGTSFEMATTKKYTTYPSLEGVNLWRWRSPPMFPSVIQWKQFFK
jgi:hypothetical protein